MVSLMSIYKRNLRYINAVNSADRRQFLEFLEELLEDDNAFIKRYYVWNIIRGREFYKNLAHYVITAGKDILSGNSEDIDCTMMRIESIIKMVMLTESRKAVRQSFVWNITKQVPIVTTDTIQYMSAERLTNIIQSEKRILHDDALSPIISEIIRLKTQLHQNSEILDNTISVMLGE